MRYIIGIDEAGRGPLAGNVYVGAVMLPKNHKQLFIKTKAPQKLADSKKLTLVQREEWFLWMRQNNIPYAYAAATVKQIDKLNISRACNKAAQRAYNKFKTGNQQLKTNNNQRAKYKNTKVIADAGIKIEALHFESFSKADELIPAVSLASIVAKVMRDRYMLRVHKKYPRYGFDKHKGYGTKKHYAAIKKYGASRLHRLTFLRSLPTMKKRSK